MGYSEERIAQATDTFSYNGLSSPKPTDYTAGSLAAQNQSDPKVIMAEQNVASSILQDQKRDEMGQVDPRPFNRPPRSFGLLTQFFPYSTRMSLVWIRLAIFIVAVIIAILSKVHLF